MVPKLTDSLSRISRKLLLTVTFILAGFHLCSSPAWAQTAPIRINGGGSAYADSMGRSWAADSYYSGGSKYSKSTSIANTSDPGLYQSERYGNFSYNIPLASGSYLVTLHFAEIFFTSAGKRVFDVSAEGSLKLNDLDIVAKAGAAAAYKTSFTTPVTDGTLNLVFTSVVDNAKISAIEVEPVELVVSPSSLSFGSTILGQSSSAQSVQIQNKGASSITINSVGLFGSGAASYKASGTYPMTLAAGQTATIAVTFTPAYEGTNPATLEIVPQSPLQAKDIALSGTGVKPATTTPGTTLINSGGAAFTDSTGRQWSADTGYSGGSSYSTNSTISGTTDQALYRSERYGNFSYRLPVSSSGAYEVTLHFAEIFFTAAGKRVFDVYAENNLAVSSLDIVAAVGALKPLTKTVNVQVSDGAVDLRFVSKVDNAKVSGISIKPSSGTTPPPPPPPPTTGTSCSRITANNPGVIWCDDFDSTATMSSKYWEYDNNGGDFTPLAGVGQNGSTAMRVIWQPGEVGAGSFKRSFGRTPSWLRSQSNSTQDFRDIYWRIDLQDAAGWSGAPYKLSRATSFGSDTSWAQAMIAHVWSHNTNPVMLIDPASGIKNNTLVTTKYNDFANLTWLGARTGTTQVFSSSNAGKWFCVEAHAKLNTAGLSDGKFEMWINGNLEASSSNLNWVGSWAKYGINSVFIENYWNTGAPGQRIRYLDNFVISTQRIGCGN